VHRQLKLDRAMSDIVDVVRRIVLVEVTGMDMTVILGDCDDAGDLNAMRRGDNYRLGKRNQRRNNEAQSRQHGYRGFSRHTFQVRG